MQTWGRWTIGVMVLVLGAAAGAWAQDAVATAIGRPLTGVRFEIEGKAVTSADLDSLVAMKAGDPLRLDAVRDAESHLISARGYESVQVLMTENAAGVELIFKLTPRHPVDRIQFTGDTGLSSNELDALLREHYSGLPVREQPRSVAQVLEGLLKDEGFPDATVESRLDVTHDPDRATLVLNVAAGSRPLIARTDVKGDSPLTAERVIALTDTAPGRPFRRRELEPRLLAMEDDLRKQGYYSAVATLVDDPVFSETDHGLVVSLSVEAGPRVTLEWDGPKPPGDPETFVPMQRQQSVDEDLLEDSDQRVASYWNREGYKDAKVTHTRTAGPDHLVVTMHVQRGLRYRIADLQITGNAHVPLDAVRETLGIRSDAAYDEALISSGIARLQQRYLRLGYAQIAIKELDPQEVPGSRTALDVRVVVHIDVAEGPEVRVGSLSLIGMKPAFEPILRRLMQSQAGGPYVFEFMRRDQAEIETYYRNLGFERVDVTVKLTPASDQRTMDVAMTISEGPQIIVGDIRVDGNHSVSEQAIKAQMTLKEGQPFGEAARRESARVLYQMGIFRSVDIDEEPRASGETSAHVIVTVQELPATSISYGGGLEGGRQPLKTGDAVEDRTFITPRAFFEIGRRNLWGKNRSVDFFSRVAPRPATTTTSDFGFTEYRVSGTYREPHVFNSAADVLLGISSEQAVRTGFNFERKGVSAQASRRIADHVNVTGRYGLEYTRLFDVDPTIIGPADQVTIDRLFPQVRLSMFSTGLVWDRRDDLVNPVHGTLASADVEVAARGLGSEVGYSKIFLQTSGFHALTPTHRVVVAARAEIGVARGFQRTVVDANGQTQTVEDLPISQRFFAGGSTTVRGFELDRLGVPAVLTPDGLSLGGNGVVVLNGELRTTVGKLLGRDFGITLFTDAGNVFAKASEIDLSELRTAYGFGFRYNSPLGPVRLDFGFKTDRQIVGGERERGWEYHLNIGEAF